MKDELSHNKNKFLKDIFMASVPKLQLPSVPIKTNQNKACYLEQMAQI